MDLTVLSRGMSSQGFNAGGPLDSVVATDSKIDPVIGYYGKQVFKTLICCRRAFL